MKIKWFQRKQNQKPQPTQKSPENQVANLLQRNPLQQNKSSGLGNLEQSPNLLSQSFYNPKIEQSKRNVTKSLIILIVGIQAVFLAVLFYSYKLSLDIDVLNKEIAELSAQTQQNRSIQLETAQTITKLNLHKQLTLNQPSFAKRANILTEGLTPRVEVISIIIEEDIGEITFKTDEPLAAAVLISRYFENDRVEEITIQRASLNNALGNFVISLEVLFND